MMLDQNEFDKNAYLKTVNSIINETLYHVNIGEVLFGAALVVVPFCAAKLLIDNGMVLTQLHNINKKGVCTDKYGRDEQGRILNSAGLPKNPQSADDLPDHDITVDDIVPSPIDQHGTCGMPAPQD